MKRSTGRKFYRYVGPAEIKRLAKNEAVPEPLVSLDALLKRLDALGFRRQDGSQLTVTFVIDARGHLRIADRRSEHVVCAGHGDVLSAGEMTFGWNAGGCVVENVTNQSTGYCPEAEAWPAVDCALNELPIPHPDVFDPAFIFRRCDACLQTNLVKDGWFVCSVCGATLRRALELLLTGAKDRSRCRKLGIESRISHEFIRMSTFSRRCCPISGVPCYAAL